MSTTLELPDDVMTAVVDRARQTGMPVQDVAAQLLRQALAVDTMPSSKENCDAMQIRRQEMTQKFLTGEWAVELAGYEASRAADECQDAERARAWRN